MQRKTPKWLEDIRLSCEVILSATVGRTLKDYQRDPS